MPIQESLGETHEATNLEASSAPSLFPVPGEYAGGISLLNPQEPSAEEYIRIADEMSNFITFPETSSMWFDFEPNPYSG